jgi:hypothetical protein
MYDSDDGLTAGIDVDMLDGDLLLPLAAVAIERLEQEGTGAGEPIRLAQVLTAPLKRLFGEHGTPVALHSRIVCGQELSRDHPFQLVFRPDTHQPINGCAVLLVTSVLVGGQADQL